MKQSQIEELSSREELRIVQRIFLSAAKQKRIVAFTAPDRGDGCTWIMARVGAKLAACTRKSVCLVDANLRWPALHNIFPAASCPGCGRKNDRIGLLQALTE